MQYTKKMMLVDAQNFGNDFRNIKRHLSSLDLGISEILERDDISDRDKLHLYQQSLRKFLLNRQQVENALNTPLNVKLDDQQTNAIVDTPIIPPVNEPPPPPAAAAAFPAAGLPAALADQALHSAAAAAAAVSDSIIRSSKKRKRDISRPNFNTKQKVASRVKKTPARWETY
jgi:hypothetical protein